MNLLDEIKHPQLMEIGRKLQQFCDALSAHDTRHTTEWLAAMQVLARTFLVSIQTASVRFMHILGLTQVFKFILEIAFGQSMHWMKRRV